MSEPLNDEELEFVSTALLKYGNDDSILDVSELDGFLTAIISGPQTIMPSQWFPELWGGPGREPNWQSTDEVQYFFSLVCQHLNNNAMMLMEYPDEFVAMFNISHADEGITIAEEWCFGYMRGVGLGDWTGLPPEMKTNLKAIALYGSEDHFSEVEALSLEQHQQAVRNIEPAVRALHKYFLDQRKDLAPQNVPVKASPTVGRNDPCPCGSGKKFKQCCLH